MAAESVAPEKGQGWLSGADWCRGRRAWLLAMLLYLPMAAVIALHLLVPPAGLWPTGFLQYDQGGYMAMAREGFDRTIMPHPFFALPATADPASPRVYSYPHLFALGLVEELLDADPGRLYRAEGIALADPLTKAFVRPRDLATLQERVAALEALKRASHG